MKHFDVAIIGAGFAGSLLAMIARRLGRSVVLLERGVHPRFAIGESSTPLANLLLEQLSDRYDLPRVRPLSKWGSWQRTYPEIACGRKRGFSFFHHKPGQPFAAEPEHANELLVGASPNDELADTHWYRPEFDHFLAQEAQRLGVEYLDQANLGAVTFEGGSVQVEGDRLGRRLAIQSKLLLDASGPRGFLHRALQLAEAPFTELPQTQALFSHFRGVERFEKIHNNHGEPPPYPVDDAALHHVFDGGWVWVLRFNNELTSAGVAATDQLAQELALHEGINGWKRLLQRFPTVAEQFAPAEAILPFMHMPRLGFRSGAVAGPNWALLPSAAGFVDPLLSSGFTLTLLGVNRLASIIDNEWEADRMEGLQVYSRQTIQELLVVERLVAALYASMRDFASFSVLTLLYFAPVSFAEMAHRLGRSARAASFLLCEDSGFGPAAERLLKEALAILRSGDTLSQRPDIAKRVLQLIAPFDVIGLSDPQRKNWHPARDSDLLRSAPKLGVSQDEMEGFLSQQASPILHAPPHCPTFTL